MQMKGTNSLSFILHQKLDRIREGLNIRPETLKLLEEERSKTLQNIGINYFFFLLDSLKLTPCLAWSGVFPEGSAAPLDAILQLNQLKLAVFDGRTHGGQQILNVCS